MITIKNEYLVAEIDELGAQLSRLASENTEFVYDNLSIWPKHAPVLFPFAGRLQDQVFEYKGKTYGPVQIHGFAPYAQYEPSDRTMSSVRMNMVISDEIKAIWPFDFAFSVLFELKERTLCVSYEVSNNGTDTMYYGMGSHPGFNVPLSRTDAEGNELRFEDYYISFPNAEGTITRNIMSESCLDSGKAQVYEPAAGGKLDLSHDLFDTDAVILNNTGFRAVIETDKDPKKVIVEYPDTRYCAVWHKVRMEVPFVCIEPWTSLPGPDGVKTNLETKKDYNSLDAGQKRVHHLNITCEG